MMLQKIKKVGCGFMLVLVGLVGITAVYVAIQVLLLPSQSKVSSTLSRMYVEDQDVREAGIENPLDILVFIGGDWIRVNKTRRIVAADLLSTADDYAYAARILQHGDEPSDYLAAHELSIKAYELGNEEMLRHSALAEDRYLVAIGQPQKYGSQFFCEPEGGWQLSPVDSTVTDEERAQVNIEPLADMEAKVENLNEVTQGKCSLTGDLIQQVETIMEGGS